MRKGSQPGCARHSSRARSGKSPRLTICSSSAALSSASEDEDEGLRLDHEATDGETPESVLATRQIANAVNQAIEALPEDLRTAIVLRELEGLSYEDIAQAMECPVGTVRSRIFRAREAIDRKLSDVFEGGLGRAEELG